MYEGDIGLNSPSVQFEADMVQDRLRVNREIGCRSGGNPSSLHATKALSGLQGQEDLPCGWIPISNRAARIISKKLSLLQLLMGDVGPGL